MNFPIEINGRTIIDEYQLMQLAKTDAEVQNYLTEEYVYGRVNGFKDYKKAFYYAQTSAQQGNSQGMLNLAYLLRKGLGCKKDALAAEKWLLKAEEAGDPEAYGFLAELYLYGWGPVKMDIVKGMSYVLKGIRSGYDMSEVLYALNMSEKEVEMMYDQLVSGPDYLVRGLEVKMMAALKQEGHECVQGVEDESDDFEEDDEWNDFEDDDDEGEDDDYEDEEDDEEDEEDNEDNEDDDVDVSDLIQEWKGSRFDYAEEIYNDDVGERWIYPMTFLGEQANNEYELVLLGKTNPEAQYFLGKACLNGGFSLDYVMEELACTYLLRAAEQGHLKAMILCAILLITRDKVRDLKKAEELLLKAKDMGNEPCVYMLLAELYLCGSGEIEQDVVKGLQYAFQGFKAGDENVVTHLKVLLRESTFKKLFELVENNELSMEFVSKIEKRLQLFGMVYYETPVADDDQKDPLQKLEDLLRVSDEEDLLHLTKHRIEYYQECGIDVNDDDETKERKILDFMKKCNYKEIAFKSPEEADKAKNEDEFLAGLYEKKDLTLDELNKASQRIASSDLVEDLLKIHKENIANQIDALEKKTIQDRVAEVGSDKQGLIRLKDEIVTWRFTEKNTKYGIKKITKIISDNDQEIANGISQKARDAGEDECRELCGKLEDLWISNEEKSELTEMLRKRVYDLQMTEIKNEIGKISSDKSKMIDYYNTLSSSRYETKVIEESMKMLKEQIDTFDARKYSGIMGNADKYSVSECEEMISEIRALDIPEQDKTMGIGKLTQRIELLTKVGEINRAVEQIDGKSTEEIKTLYADAMTYFVDEKQAKITQETIIAKFFELIKQNKAKEIEKLLLRSKQTVTALWQVGMNTDQDMFMSNALIGVTKEEMLKKYNADSLYKCSAGIPASGNGGTTRTELPWEYDILIAAVKITDSKKIGLSDKYLYVSGTKIALSDIRDFTYAKGFLSGTLSIWRKDNSHIDVENYFAKKEIDPFLDYFKYFIYAFGKTADGTEVDAADGEQDKTRDLEDIMMELFMELKSKAQIFNMDQTMITRMQYTLEVPNDERVYLAHDDTFLRTGKTGFVITNKGFYCRTAKGKTRCFTSLEKLAEAEVIWNPGANELQLSGVPITVISSNANVQQLVKETLDQLSRHLRSIGNDNGAE